MNNKTRNASVIFINTFMTHKIHLIEKKYL